MFLLPQNEKAVPRFYMMNNHLLSESCSAGDYREYGAIMSRAGRSADHYKRSSQPPPEQCMQAQPKEHHKFIKVVGDRGAGESTIKKLSREPVVGNKKLLEK